jgi:formylglycine-generating enzyme required for sulfatase activity
MKHVYWSTAIVVAVSVLLGVPGCDNRNKVIDGIEFVWCPAGTFLMGSAPGEPNGFFSENPQHAVTFAHGFWISKNEVTEAQWLAVMDGGLPHYNGCHPASLDDRPVGQVSWNDTQSFVAALNALRPGMNFRLPSEAEWEYACRAGTTTPYIWGSDPSDTELDKYAWHDGNSGGDTHDVGTKLPNAWGICDMYGNVWEWVQDSEHQDYNGEPTDGSAWEDAGATNRVARGGSFYNGDGCRSALRAIMNATGIWGDYGFRIVKVPDEAVR